jgi:hypothetical protein
VSEFLLFLLLAFLSMIKVLDVLNTELGKIGVDGLLVCGVVGVRLGMVGDFFKIFRSF